MICATSNCGLLSRRGWGPFFCLLCLLLFLPNAHAVPQRIISLAPSITELAYAAGMGDRLVAVTAYSDYPAEAQQLPRVGDAFRLDWERLITLKPDWVLAWGSGLSMRDRARFEQLGIPLLVLEPHRLADIPVALRQLGREGGTAAVAEVAARDFERRQAELSARYANQPPLRVWLQIADTPLLTVNGQHIFSEVLQLCGAQNVFAAAPLLTPAVSTEALLAARPQLLLALADTPQQETAIRRHWARLPLKTATGFIPADWMSRPGPRLLLGAERVCQKIEQARARPSAGN